MSDATAVTDLPYCPGCEPPPAGDRLDPSQFCTFEHFTRAFRLRKLPAGKCRCGYVYTLDDFGKPNKQGTIRATCPQCGYGHIRCWGN